jgi:hypothetical protein
VFSQTPFATYAGTATSPPATITDSTLPIYYRLQAVLPNNLVASFNDLTLNSIMPGQPRWGTAFSPVDTQLRNFHYLSTAPDAAGNTLAILSFSGSLTIGGVTYTCPTNYIDFLLLKLDSNGSMVAPFPKHYGGGTGVIWPTSLALDSTGKIIVGGGFYFDVDVGDINGPFSTGGIQAGFVARFSATGAYDWFTSFGGIDDTCSCQVTELAVDSLDKIVVAGWFGLTADNGTGTNCSIVPYNGGGIVLARTSPVETFLAKLATDGNSLSWAHNWHSGAGSNSATSVAIDRLNNNEIVFVGSSGQQINFGGGNIVAGGYLARFSALGVYIAAISIPVFKGRVRVDDASFVVVAGTNPDPNAPTYDSSAAIIRYQWASSLFTAQWTAHIPYSGNYVLNNIIISALATDRQNSIYISGGIYGQAEYGPSVRLTSLSGKAFLVKFTSAGTDLWGQQFGAGNTNFAGNMVYDGDLVRSTVINSENLPVLGATFYDTIMIGNQSFTVASGKFGIVVAKYAS